MLHIGDHHLELTTDALFGISLSNARVRAELGLRTPLPSKARTLASFPGRILPDLVEITPNKSLSPTSRGLKARTELTLPVVRHPDGTPN